MMEVIAQDKWTRKRNVKWIHVHLMPKVNLEVELYFIYRNNY